MLNEVTFEKAIFTEAILPVLQAIDSSIAYADYQVYGFETEREIVVIEYRNGYKKSANVTGDSLKALAIDVLESL